MAFVLADRVKETTTTVGTGTVTLAGASTGFQSFAAIGNGNTTYYTIAAQVGTEWEVGIGTYTSAGTTLTRTTVLSSSNAGALVTFSAGTKDVFVTQPSERTVYVDTTNATSTVPISVASNGLFVNSQTVSASYTVPVGSSAMSAGPITIASGQSVTVSSGSRWVVL